MPKVLILYNNFYDMKKKHISVGGIQTYLRNLCNILFENGVESYVFQFASENFEIQVDNINIIGVDVGEKNTYKKKKRILLKKAMEMINASEDVLLFASESVLLPTKGVKTICIQHGVEWDKPTKRKWGITSCSRSLVKHIGQYKRLFLMSKVDWLICVDYNFINWSRAAFPDLKTNYRVILNFSKIPTLKKVKNTETLSIIFARRFFEYRGTRIFASAIQQVLKKYSDISVTIAGEGPDEEFLKLKLGGDERINFIKYSADESLDIHSKHDIAVVPTMGSEGSSLSLIEAMASGCATICTDVGGMTNIVLDGINGLMIRPNEFDLFNALTRLIEDYNLRATIAENGIMTVEKALSFERWKKEWTMVFCEVGIIKGEGYHV